MPWNSQFFRATLLKFRTLINHRFSNRTNLLVLVTVLAACVVILGVTTAFLLTPANYDEDYLDQQPVDASADIFRHPLTGVAIDTPFENIPQVYAVMIENSSDAWPLSGIEDAFLVIEAPVEAGIPRFEAFFANDMQVNKIGPVRSARPYYLDWNDELSGLYAHVGGSPEALDLIAEYDTLDLNEFSQGEYFWRDTARRAAPHNVYTSTELLHEGLDELKPEQAAYDSWQFKLDAPFDVDPLSIVIDWGQGELYDVTWVYQPEINQYLRLQGNQVVETQDGDQVLANNVVVMATNITVIDSLGRRQITTVGDGDALVVQDGRMILGRWQKTERTERLRFYTTAGEELAMNAGTTWIAVVPSLNRVESFINSP